MKGKKLSFFPALSSRLRGYALWFGIIGLLFISGAFFVHAKEIDKSSTTTINRHEKFQTLSVRLFPTPTTMQTPTASPTANISPTPFYTGYCLHVPVLMYHHTAPQAIAAARGQTSLNVDNEWLDQQMAYIASHGFATYTTDDLVNALRTHTILAGKPIIITLDDGYDDVYTYAFPIFKKYGLKFNLIIPTGLLGNSSPGNSYYSWGQVKDMLSSGLAHIVNHTWSHYSMGADNVKDEYELVTSQNQFQQVLGITPRTFAYPYGTGIYPNVIALLQQNGFWGAFSTIPGQVQCDSFIMSLHRTRVGNAPITAYGIY